MPNVDIYIIMMPGVVYCLPIGNCWTGDVTNVCTTPYGRIALGQFKTTSRLEALTVEFSLPASYGH